MPSQVKIYDKNGWTIVSYGNGWAYHVSHKPGNGKAYAMWLQDEDAEAFRSRVMDEDGMFVHYCEDAFAEYYDVMTECEQHNGGSNAA